MRRIKALSFVLASAVAMSMFTFEPEKVVFANEGDVVINETNFPDPVFRDYVSSHFDTDSNKGVLSETERNNAKRISIAYTDLENIDGFSYFPNLYSIDLRGNKLASLDLSGGLSDLQWLDVSSNELVSLDVRNCPRLERLECYGNPLAGNILIDDSAELRRLSISRTEMTGELDVSGFPSLKELYCSDNHLTSINVSNNRYLENLMCDYNDLTALNVDNNPNLQVLTCRHNNISSIDVSGKADLVSVCAGQNPDLSSINVSNCPSLLCVNCYGDTNIRSLDLTGTRNLVYLIMHNCKMPGTLDLDGMSSLKQVDLYNNDLTGLSVNGCTDLEYLYITNNDISSIDLSTNTSLIMFECDCNDLTSLDVSSNTSLVVLACFGNALTELDVSSNTALNYLRVFGTDIEQIDIRNNPKLIDLYLNGTAANSSLPVYKLDNKEFSYTVYSSYWTPFGSGGSVYHGYEFAVDPDMTVIYDDESAAAAAAASNPTGDPTGAPINTGTPVNTGTPANTGTPSPSGSGNGASSTPVTTVTPIPTESGSSSSSTPAPSSSPQIFEPGVGGFVDRLYVIALDRTSDPVGRADWIAAITERGTTGADAARGFLYSDEFLNKQVSNEDFVRILYRTFFDREPDIEGYNAWVNVLNNGESKQHVIEGFINSTEWANLCLLYGIASGGTGVPNIEADPNQSTIDFCTRLYTTCLERNADQDGLMAWARQLANRRDSGSGAARGFFFSSEFIGQNVDNGEYVRRLYRTFMGREADEEGYNAWVAQLDEGVSREVVFAGFAESPEFTRICASYGILR
ncbi:MAG: DUF4214 domain-containing protein [Clostridiales bacterium]|nr:DUF4214 domain-containing protein [Clostridiales bacterium]